MAVGANLTAPRTRLIPDKVPGGADDPAANEVTPGQNPRPYPQPRRQGETFGLVVALMQ